MADWAKIVAGETSRANHAGPVKPKTLPPALATLPGSRWLALRLPSDEMVARVWDLCCEEGLAVVDHSIPGVGTNRVGVGGATSSACSTAAPSTLSSNATRLGHRSSGPSERFAAWQQRQRTQERRSQEGGPLPGGRHKAINILYVKRSVTTRSHPITSAFATCTGVGGGISKITFGSAILCSMHYEHT